jgi:hypothetical protein
MRNSRNANVCFTATVAAQVLVCGAGATLANPCVCFAVAAQVLVCGAGATLANPCVCFAVAAQVLVSTATCCWGMTNSAKLVVIMGTQYYDGTGLGASDYPVTDLLQMLGRASRPGKDEVRVLTTTNLHRVAKAGIMLCWGGRWITLSAAVLC